MPTGELHYRWQWRLQSPPETIWSLVADTNRFNRDANVPPLDGFVEATDVGVNARRRLRMFRLNLLGLKVIPIEWEEEPFEWVRPLRFGVVRRYTTGPLAQMRVLVQLRPQSGGTHATYEVWATPRSAIWFPATIFQIGILSAFEFRRAFHRYDRLMSEGLQPAVLPAASTPGFAPGGRHRLDTLCGQLVTQGMRLALVDKLAGTIARADDAALAHIRPYALADAWGESRREVLELCLRATRIGLLDFSWDLLCPLCRGAKISASTLGDVRADVHCDTCKIDFTVNFDRSVELTFRSNPSVRAVELSDFCVAGPQITPHIVVQQLMQPGEQRIVTPALEEGRYRLRTLALKGGQYLQVAQDGALEHTICVDGMAWSAEEPCLSPLVELRLENETHEEQLFILERMAWSDQAVTAAEVTGLQMFRDLFSREALRPGERISVGTLTVLFTDMVNSTQLYREIGDAPAFGLVMEHFDVLRDAITSENGAIVKTIGDSVMAIFPRPINALRAVLRAQEILLSPPSGVRPLLLKAGIHSGASIAVTLNDRLDYFGTTVNLAARLEGLSHGGDVVMSPTVRFDPEVAELLTYRDVSLRVEPFEATLKGFDQERFELWNVMPTRMAMMSN